MWWLYGYAIANAVIWALGAVGAAASGESGAAAASGIECGLAVLCVLVGTWRLRRGSRTVR